MDIPRIYDDSARMRFPIKPVNPIPGSGATSKNRFKANIAKAAGIQTIEYQAGVEVTYVSVTCVLHEGETLSGDEYVAFTVDAADTTAAETALGVAPADVPSSLTNDLAVDIVPLNEIVAQPQLVPLTGGTNGTGRVDFRVLGSSALDVHIGAS